MLINKDEVKRLMKEHKLVTQDDLNALFRNMIKDAIETIYEGELTELLGYNKYERGKNRENSRNGYGSKTVKSNFGEIDLSIPRDRNSQYEPQLVKKRQTDITGIEENNQKQGLFPHRGILVQAPIPCCIMPPEI